MLEWHVARHPDRVHLTLLDGQGEVERTLTYAELAQAARRVAAGLIARDVEPGDRIALMLPTGIDFFTGFFGALYAGAVPVPIYPPARLSQIEEHMQRQAGILRNAGARILLTAPQALTVASLLRGPVETLEAVDTVARLSDAAATALPQVRNADATAFIQYTSNSLIAPTGRGNRIIFVLMGVYSGHSATQTIRPCAPLSDHPRRGSPVGSNRATERFERGATFNRPRCTRRIRLAAPSSYDQGRSASQHPLRGILTFRARWTLRQ
jgi:non-ribosomal peptide synthetase component F